jgi:hypothetical protein
MQEPQIIAVTLSALVDGGMVRLVDSHGKKIAVIPLDIAEEASSATTEQMLLRAKWKYAFAGMIGSLNNKLKSRQVTAWQRKTQVWQASLRWRRNRQKPQFKQRSKKYSEASRPDWTAAVSCMLRQYNGRLHEARLRRANQWRLWAQTVAGNHRKKGAMRDDRREYTQEAESVGDSQPIRRLASPAGVQMQIDWRGTDAEAVLVGS